MHLLIIFDASMLQLNTLRNDTDRVRAGIQKKFFDQPDLIDEILSLDKQNRALQTSTDELKSQMNKAAKQIGQLMGAGKKEEAEQAKSEVAGIKTKIQAADEEADTLSKAIHEALVQLPNVPHELVKEGKTEEDNEILMSCDIPTLSEDALPHWELTEKYELINFELGTKITGSGFPVYTGQGAKLQRALIQYFLDYNTKAGYKEIIPPFLVNEDSAFGTGQLPDKEGQMYHATADNFYLIPTSEVPVTNMYRNEIIKGDKLPIKLTAYSPCFRREAGSYGKDVRGLNRLHQFEKVEIVQIVPAAASYDVLDQMVKHVEELLKALNLPYRILRLCSGDVSFASAMTYDFEVYSAAQKRWLEVSSVSNFESFQTNRMKIRTKNTEGKSELLHSLNGSSLALPRIVACLLENNQDADGINLPEVLHSYFGSERIK